MNAQSTDIEFEINLDLEGRITSASPLVERSIGYHAEELVGQPLTSLVHFQDLPGLSERLRLALAGDSGEHALRLLGKYGDIRQVRASSRPLFREGNAVGLSALIIDVTPGEN